MSEPQIIRNGESYDLDTREQLEVDMIKLCHMDMLQARPFLELLDRQAAITRRECDRPNWDYCETCDALAELTAERDELRERLGAMKAVLDKWVKSTVGIEPPDCPITEFQPKDKDRRIAELTAEREQYRDNLLAQSRRVAELTAERDELQAAIDAMGNGQFYAMYKAKCDECEQLKKVVRTQAESFKKLECELAGKDG